MTEIIDFLNSISPFVQAVSTIGIAVLTIFLVVATKRYADTAEQQRDEMVAQRQAGYQPYIHATSATVNIQPQGQYLSSLRMRLKITNVGEGPALGVRAHLAHEYATFIPRGCVDTDDAPAHSALRGGPWLLQSGQYIALSFEVTASGSGLNLTQRAVFLVEYHDLVGKLWSTSVPIAFRGGEDSPGVFVGVSAAFEDAQEKVGPSMQHLIRSDGMGLEAAPKKAAKLQGR